MGECVFSQSLRAASTRVCQPSPVARNACSTSLESRMVVDTLVGDFCGPRWRIPSVFCKLGGRASLAGRKVLKSAAVKVRTSPSAPMRELGFFIIFHFTRVGLAKTDDPDAVFCRRKAKHMQAPVQETNGHVSRFKVGLAQVLPDDGRVEIKISCTVERQASSHDVGVVLGRVKFDHHEPDCSNKLGFCTFSGKNRAQLQWGPPRFQRVLCYCARNPPSMASVCPVTMPAAGLAR